MKIKQYQEMYALDSGSTTYELDMCKILGIDINKNIKEVRNEVANKVKNIKKEFNNRIKLNGTWYMADEDFLECTFEQFVELDRILAEEDNINNLHKLLAIYLRPMKFNVRKLKHTALHFDIKHQEYISNELKEHMEMDDANSYILFFYQNATRSLRYMSISYLNQMKMASN